MGRESIPSAEFAGLDIKLGMGAAAGPAPRSSVRSSGRRVRVIRESGIGERGDCGRGDAPRMAGAIRW